MSSMRNAVQRRPHRERAQPQGREKWGILEKHKVRLPPLMPSGASDLSLLDIIGLLSPRKRLQCQKSPPPPLAPKGAGAQPR